MEGLGLEEGVVLVAVVSSAQDRMRFEECVGSRKLSEILDVVSPGVSGFLTQS